MLSVHLILSFVKFAVCGLGLLVLFALAVRSWCAPGAGGTTRVSTMAYDFRNRRVTTDGEVDYFEKSYYDNLDRVTKNERYNTSLSGNLLARNETKFDDRGRVYRTIRYGVDPDTGTVGNSLTDNTWFDPVGNVLKSLPAGSDLFTKTESDSLNRPETRYTGYDLDETGYPG